MEKLKIELSLTGLIALFVFGLTMISAPAIVFSATTDSSSTSSSSSSSGGSSDKGTSNSKSDKPETVPKNDNPPSSTITEPVNPINPNPQITTPANPEKPIVPTQPQPEPEPGPVIAKQSTPDFSCHFHPEAKKCAADKDGNCPGGFASNDHGQCHPVGPCPPGFGRHDDDESGKCFRTGPIPHSCPPKFHNGPHHRCERDIVININKHTTSSSSGGSHSLSSSCFNEIKIAWLGKIKRGNNAAVDSVIDKCLGVSNLP
jgi:hypothetical protein